MTQTVQVRLGDGPSQTVQVLGLGSRGSPGPQGPSGPSGPPGVAWVREINGTYETRPPLADMPNAFWIGVADATLDPSFVAWTPTTGAGDTWQQVPV